MAYTVDTNGKQTDVAPANGTDFSLKELQSFVGGFIELVTIATPAAGTPKHALRMVVNEDGRMMGLPMNRKASLIANQPIVGNVLVVENHLIK